LTNRQVTGNGHRVLRRTPAPRWAPHVAPCGFADGSANPGPPRHTWQLSGFRGMIVGGFAKIVR